MDILPAHSIFGVQMFCIRTLVKENDGKRKEVQSMRYDGPFNVVHLVWSRHEKLELGLFGSCCVQACQT